MSEYGNYARARMSFRPSVYSTGIQEVQAYQPNWPQGVEYGSWYNPFGWGEDDTGVDSKLVGGTCIDHAGLLGTPGAKVSCAALKSEQTGEVYERYKPVGKTITDASLSDYIPDVNVPEWAPDILKSDDQLATEQDRRDEEDEKKFRRRALLGAGVGVLLLSGLFIYQRGEAQKLKARGIIPSSEE